MKNPADKYQELLSILTAIDEGVLVIGPDLIVSSLCSHKATVLLGSSPAGKDIGDVFYPELVLKKEHEQKRDLRVGLKACFDFFVPSQFSVAVQALPQEINYRCPGQEEPLVLSLHYGPVIENESIVEIIISFTDSTIAANARNIDIYASSKTNTWVHNFTQMLTNDPLLIKSSMQDLKGIGDAMLRECAELEKLDVSSLFHHLHTFKGSMHALGISYLEELTHETEDLIAGILDPEASREDFDFQQLVHKIKALTNGINDLVQLSRYATSSTKGGNYGLWEMTKNLIASSAIKVAPSMEKELVVEILGEEPLVGKDLTIFKKAMLHMIRNSLDHGIETVATRKILGKNPAGSIKIEVVDDTKRYRVRIEDDGKGIERTKVLSLAMQKGIIKHAKDTSNEQILAILCTLGFSVKDKVGQVSGRGVGMDVVKSLAEEHGGMLALEKSDQRGTVFVMEWEKQEGV